MATLGDSPTVFSGQSWSSWQEKISEDCPEESSSPLSSTSEDQKESDSMKLRKEDIGLYGICPARDEFYLVVCECCGQVIKPQALQRHLELRHSFSPKNSCSSSESSGSPVKQATHKSLSQDSDHKHTHNAHKSAKRSNPLPRLPPNGKPPESSKCEKIVMVKVERIHTGGEMKDHNSSKVISKPSFALPHSVKNEDVDLNQLVKHEDVVYTAGYEELQTPTTVILTTIAPSLSIDSSAPVFSTVSSVLSPTTVCLSSPKTSFSSKNSSSLLMKSPSLNITPKNSITSVPSTKVTSSLQRISPAVSASLRTQVLVSSSSGSLISGNLISEAKPLLALAPARIKESSKFSLASDILSSSSSTATSLKTVKPAVKLSRVLSKNSKTSARKTPLCKDREYDANKHCGVWIDDHKRQCTRSLTCKTHSLSMRRAVEGRIKPFDDLLREHREAKEALQPTKPKSDGISYKHTITSTTPTAKTVTKSPSLSAKMKPNPTTPVSAGSIFKSPQSEKRLSLSAITSPAVTDHLLPAKDRLCLNAAISRQSSQPVFACGEAMALSESLSYLSSDGEEEEEERDHLDYSYITNHPRPAAVNSFGSWRHSAGCHVFNRREDLYRSAFYSAVERHLHPPPHKKLCLESKLPKGSTISTNVKDPYEFAFGDATQTGSSWKLGSANRSNNKSVSRNSVGGSPTSNKLGIFSMTSPSSSFTSGFDIADVVVTTIGSNMQSPPSSVKRKRSGSSPKTNSINNINNGPMVTALLHSSNNSQVGQSSSKTCSSPLAITIPPSINFSSTTLSNINTKYANAQVLSNRNNIVNEVNINSSDSQINGQLGCIIGASPGDMTHIQLNSLSDKCARAKTGKNSLSLQPPILTKSSLNKSPMIWNACKTSPIRTSSVLSGMLHMDTQMSNAIQGTTVTISSGSSVIGDSGAQVSPVHLASPVLLAGPASPSSPVPNGLLTPTKSSAKYSDSSSLGNNFHVSEGLTRIDLALTEQLLSQHSASFSMAQVRGDGLLSHSLSTSPLLSSLPSQVTMSTAAATAQQLAAAALNLTTQANCILTTNNSVPQQIYATHVLTKTSPTATLGSLQLQTRDAMKFGGTLGKVPLRPMSLTILGPGTTVGNSPHHSHLVLHTPDDAKNVTS